MTKLATAIFAAALSTTFAAGALAADIQITSEQKGPTIQFNVTKAGEPLSNYPVELKGADVEQYVTSEDGTVSLSPSMRSAHLVTLTVSDSNGEKITETALVSADR